MVPPEMADQGFAILRGAMSIDFEPIGLARSARITPGKHLIGMTEGQTQGHLWLVAKVGHEYVATSERSPLLAVTWITHFQIEDKTTGEMVAREDYRCQMIGGCRRITE